MKVSLYTLSPNETLDHGFRRMLKRMALKARRLEIKPVASRGDSIHEIRLLIKRLRALLWFVRPALDPGLITQTGADLRRAAGGLGMQRDLAVILATLQSLRKKMSSHRNQLDALDKELREKSAAAAIRGDGEPDVLREMVAQYLKTIVEVENEIRKDADWPDPKKRMARAFRVEEKAGRRALRSGGDVDFHRWRKKAKRLGYLLQLMQLAGFKYAKRELKRADRLQNVLGKYHDFAVTQTWLSKEHGRAAARMIRLLGRKKRELWKKAETKSR